MLTFDQESRVLGIGNNLMNKIIGESKIAKLKILAVNSYTSEKKCDRFTNILLKHKNILDFSSS